MMAMSTLPQYYSCSCRLMDILRREWTVAPYRAIDWTVASELFAPATRSANVVPDFCMSCCLRSHALTLSSEVASIKSP